MSNIQIGRPWRTDAELARVRHLSGMRQVFAGQHRRYFFDGGLTQHVYKAIGPHSANVLYITENLAGRCTLKYADLLFGEPLQVEPDSGEQAAKDALDRIRRQSRFNQLCYDAAATAGWAGAAWWQAVIRQGAVRLEAVAPEHVFPAYDIDGRTLLGVTIKHRVDIQGVACVRVIEHLPGRINHEIWRLARGSERVEARLRPAASQAGLDDEQATGHPGLMVWELPNYSTGGVGATDYDGESLTLLDEINNRRSQISRILDIHADPAVVALASLFDENGQLKIAGKAIAADDMSSGDPVRYVTWNGELTAAATGLDSSTDAYLGHQEIAPPLVGKGGETSADSWKKFKLSAQQTIARVNRKRLHLHETLEEILLAVQQLEALHTPGAGYEPSPVGLTWSDGLPADETDEMMIVSGYYAARLMSRYRALMRIHDGDREIVEDEIARLDAEADASLPDSLQGGLLDEGLDHPDQPGTGGQERGQ